MKSQTIKTGFAFVTPFNNYIALKENFRKEHPTAKILEEIKTLTLVEMEVPDTSSIMTIGNKVKQQVIMIAYACVYSEVVDAEKVNINKLLHLKDENL